MRITGQILKENRERKGISISEVAIATKINVKSIVAMEEGDVENLPPKTFLRGFVRAYANYLELDVESVLSTFFEEMGSTKPKAQLPLEPQSGAGAGVLGLPPKRSKAHASEADQTINPKTSPAVTIGAVAGILVLVVLIVFFKNKMESYERETVVESPTGIESINPGGSPPAESALQAALAESPTPTPTPEETATAVPALVSSASPTATATPTPVASPSPTPKPSPSPSPTPTPKPSPSPSPSPSPKPSPSPSPSPSPKPSPSPSPSPSPKPSPSPTPSASPKPSPAPSASPTATATPKPAAVGKIEVIIEAFDSVDISATIDGEARSIKLRGDQVHTIKANRKVILNVSDAGAVNLIVNGNDRGVPGDLGKPKRIELP